jgi:hypothetical protein
MLLKRVVANCYPLVGTVKAKLHFFSCEIEKRPE